MDKPKLQNQYYGTNIEILTTELFKVFEKHLGQPFLDFERDIYNLETASDLGLEIWGKLLNFPRVIKGDAVNPTYTLEPDQYRIILRVAALATKSNLTITELNAALVNIFMAIDGTRKNTYLIDNKDMSYVNYVFEWYIPDWLQAAFNNYDILPHPMGVGVNVSSAIVYPIGFDGQQPEATNFYQAIWAENKATTMGMEGQTESTNFYNARYPLEGNDAE